MQGFCRRLRHHKVAPAHAWPAVVHALKLSGIAPAAACHCAVAPPEATGATVKLRRKLARAGSGNIARRRRRIMEKAALTALMSDEYLLRQLATRAFRVRLIMLPTPHERPDFRFQGAIIDTDDHLRNLTLDCATINPIVVSNHGVNCYQIYPAGRHWPNPWILSTIVNLLVL